MHCGDPHNYNTETKKYLRSINKKQSFTYRKSNSLCHHINNMNIKYGNKFRRNISKNFILKK